MVFAVFLIPFSRKPFKSYTKIIVNYSNCTIRLLFPAAAKIQKIAVLNTYERVFCRFTFFAVLYNSYLRPYDAETVPSFGHGKGGRQTVKSSSQVFQGLFYKVFNSNGRIVRENIVHCLFTRTADKPQDFQRIESFGADTGC